MMYARCSLSTSNMDATMPESSSLLPILPLKIAMTLLMVQTFQIRRNSPLKQCLRNILSPPPKWKTACPLALPPAIPLYTLPRLILVMIITATFCRQYCLPLGLNPATATAMPPCPLNHIQSPVMPPLNPHQASLLLDLIHPRSVTH
jgi:hypothetical protein